MGRRVEREKGKERERETEKKKATKGLGSEWKESTDCQSTEY